jgi:hypothetical protein
MSVQESSATALVRFTGLGIICFNDDRRRGEIGIVRDQKHSLTIRIQKPTFQEGTDSDILAYEDIAIYQDLPKENVEIVIKAEGPAISGYEIYQPGEFDRLTSTDSNDFRWIVNMSHDLHGSENLAKPAAAEPHPLTRLYIENGLFYTHSLDRKLFFEKVEKDATGGARSRADFGNVAETMGVKIEGDTVNVRIRVDGKEETHSLKRVEGLPYIIKIDNMDYSANALYSDMPDYYRYLASPSGVQFDLAPVVEDDQAQGGAVNQDDFCHPITVDGLSLDEL